MALGTLTSRLLGLVREILFASLFPRFVTDAWYAAFRVPNVFRRLFGEGSLSVSFIPVFVEARADSEARGRNLVNSFYTLFLLLLATLTALGLIFNEPIFRALLDKNYVADPEKFGLTLRMGKIMFVYIFLVCTYAYFMAILNALGRFGWAAMAPTFFNIVIIISTLIPESWTGWQGQALAWGVVIGGVVQAGVLIPSLIRLGYFPRPGRHLLNADVLKVLQAMGPGLIGMSILQITTLVNMIFATSLSEGSLSYLNLADRLMELPLSLVSVSIGTALLPTLSELKTQGELQRMVDTTDEYFRLNLFVCLAAAVGLFLLAHPIVELLFERGKFLPHETLAVADVIRVYAVSLIFISSIRVFVPAFYAVKNTWMPATASVLGLLLHLNLAPILKDEMGLRGLNLSSLASAMVNWLALMVAYRILIGPFPWRRTLGSMVRWSLPLAGMAAVLLGYPWIREWAGDHLLAKFFSLGVIMAFSVGVFALLSLVIKVSEFERVAGGLLRKIRARARSS